MTHWQHNHIQSCLNSLHDFICILILCILLYFFPRSNFHSRYDDLINERSRKFLIWHHHTQEPNQQTVCKNFNHCCNQQYFFHYLVKQNFYFVFLLLRIFTTWFVFAVNSNMNQNAQFKSTTLIEKPPKVQILFVCLQIWRPNRFELFNTKDKQEQ